MNHFHGIDIGIDALLGGAVEQPVLPVVFKPCFGGVYVDFDFGLGQYDFQVTSSDKYLCFGDVDGEDHVRTQLIQRGEFVADFMEIC